MMNARLNLLTLYPSLLAPLLFADFVFEYLDRSTGTKTRAASLEEAFHFLTRMDAASSLHLNAFADVLLEEFDVFKLRTSQSPSTS